MIMKLYCQLRSFVVNYDHFCQLRPTADFGRRQLRSTGTSITIDHLDIYKGSVADAGDLTAI